MEPYGSFFFSLLQDESVGVGQHLLINRAAREAAERPGPRAQPHASPEGWGAPQPAGTPVKSKDDRGACDCLLITSPNFPHCPVGLGGRGPWPSLNTKETRKRPEK